MNPVFCCVLLLLGLLLRLRVSARLIHCQEKLLAMKETNGTHPQTPVSPPSDS